MRRLALTLALLAALAGGAVSPPPAHAACAYIVVWHGRAYAGFGGPDQRPVDAGPKLAGALFPACNDTVGSNAHATSAPARRIVGIPPSVALLSGGETVAAFGYFPQLPGFPVENGAPPVDETHGCRLGGPVKITGPVSVGLGAIGVHVRDSTVHLHHLLRGSAQVFVDLHTRFAGLSRNGLPYIGEGQLVRVDARFCKVPGSTGTKIVARRIAAAGPIVPPTTAEAIMGAEWRGMPDDAIVAAHGYGWKAGVALALLAVAGGLLIVRRRSPRSGTG